MLDPSDLTGCLFTVDLEPAEELSASDGSTVGTEADRTVLVQRPPDLPASAERPAPSIAGYEILGELGRGGMGVVYKARQVRPESPCALKMILAGAHAGAEAAARFQAEAEAVARLQHPNIVQIYEVGEHDGLPFFALEFVDGGSLDRRLDGTPWPARRAAELVEALARGVAEAHRLGIVHRDLKPANVLLAADGTPKITDFGLAKSLDGGQRPDADRRDHGHAQLHGPRAGRGQAQTAGPRGRRLRAGGDPLRAAHGRPPFRGRPPLETLEQVRNAEPVPPSRLVPGLPRDLETICLKCLQKEPAKRYHVGHRAGRRPAAVPRRRADRARPVAVWSGLALVPAQSAGGRVAGRRVPGSS